MGKNEKLRNAQSHADPDKEKHLCNAVPAAVAVSLAPREGCRKTAPTKVVRVGSFEDTFNYVNEKGVRKGYGYELLQTLSGYTGWQFEYVSCD